MALEDEKGVLQSKTVLGGAGAVVTGVVLLLQALGYAPEGSAELIATGAAAVVSGLIAIYGRITASKAIK